MYLLTIKNSRTQQQEQLSLPLTDLELELEMKEIGISNINDPITIVNFTNDDYDFPQLPIKVLDRADVFQINFLTQRIDSLSTTDQENMNTAIEAFDIHKIDDLINLTYDIERDMYHIVEGTGDYEELGRWYVEETRYDAPSVILDNIDYNGIGYDLNIYELNGKFCEKGYVYTENPMDEKIYDGKCFPDFAYDRSYLANIEIVNNDNGLVSYLKLPAGDFAFQRVLKELETNNFNNCSIDITDGYIFGQYDYLHENEDITKLNELCLQLDTMNSRDFAKLQAVIEYVKAEGDEVFDRLCVQEGCACEKLGALYEHLEEFDFFPGIENPAEYAEHLVHVTHLFEIPDELTPYIDFAALGRDWVENEGGRFVAGGYVLDEMPFYPERTMENEVQDLEAEEPEI